MNEEQQQKYYDRRAQEYYDRKVRKAEETFALFVKVCLVVLVAMTAYAWLK